VPSLRWLPQWPALRQRTPGGTSEHHLSWTLKRALAANVLRNQWERYALTAVRRFLQPSYKGSTSSFATPVGAGARSGSDADAWVLSGVVEKRPLETSGPEELLGNSCLASASSFRVFHERVSSLLTLPT
jgi:hypothetical protein